MSFATVDKVQAWPAWARVFQGTHRNAGSCEDSWSFFYLKLGIAARTAKCGSTSWGRSRPAVQSVVGDQRLVGQPLPGHASRDGAHLVYGVGATDVVACVNRG